MPFVSVKVVIILLRNTFLRSSVSLWLTIVFHELSQLYHTTGSLISGRQKSVMLLMQCANQFSHKTTTAAYRSFPFSRPPPASEEMSRFASFHQKKQNNSRLGSWLGHVTVAVNLPSQQAATAAAASATEAHVYSLGIGIKRTLHFSKHSNVIIHQKGHSFWFYLKNYTKCCVFFSVHTIYRSHLSILHRLQHDWQEVNRSSPLSLPNTALSVIYAAIYIGAKAQGTHALCTRAAVGSV